MARALGALVWPGRGRVVTRGVAGARQRRGGSGGADLPAPFFRGGAFAENHGAGGSLSVALLPAKVDQTVKTARNAGAQSSKIPPDIGMSAAVAMLSEMNATAIAPAVRIKEVAFTGYPVTDMTRARAFYETVLGLKPGTVFDHEGK